MKTWITYTRVIDILSNPLNNHVYTLTLHEIGDTVSIRNTIDGSSLEKIKLNNPNKLLFNNNNKILYIISKEDNTISVINSTDFSIIDTINADLPFNLDNNVALNPNNNLLYVANTNNNTISVINSSDNSIIDTINVGDKPNELAFNPNNNLLYVTPFNNKMIYVVNSTDNTIIYNIPVENFIESLVLIHITILYMSVTFLIIPFM